MPNFENDTAGSHFYVVYRERDAEFWQKTDLIRNEDYAILDYDPKKIYEFRTVSVDDSFVAESEILEVPSFSNPVLKFMAKTDCPKFIIDIPSLLCRTYEYTKEKIKKLDLF